MNIQEKKKEEKRVTHQGRLPVIKDNPKTKILNSGLLMKSLFFLVAFVGVVFSAEPNPPKWPSEVYVCDPKDSSGCQSAGFFFDFFLLFLSFFFFEFF